MFLLINIIGLIVFLGIAVLFSEIAKISNGNQFRSLVVLNLFLAWFFIYFDWGQKAVRGAANGIAWVVQSAHAGKVLQFDKC
ncbi:Na+ dependent nucleoside transporter N-terminal domain-containing protein [Staphylococcus aureus]